MDDMTPVAGLPLTHLVRPSMAAPESGGRPPLLLLAHGVGSNERDLFSFADQLAPEFVVVSARAPLTLGPDAFAWFNIQLTPQGRAIAPEQLEASQKTYAEFVGEAILAYGADPARVYTLGFSQGAIISLVAALTHPHLFAGVVALSGRIPAEAVPWLAPPEETADLPVFMAHGARDLVIGIEEARAARAVLERQRVALTYTEYAADHRITPQIFADMTTWLGQRLAGERTA
ncbi:MAG TPA: alpha/beta hydrolase-fold protein [Ktedonobacterales bacterium]|nr:alpha/beta hydrolase-fold protein [Ktedonobacterales bacterium]